ncbi:MAG: hypothetical protein ACFHX7_24505 [Pseudomonadota bacterium]
MSFVVWGAGVLVWSIVSTLWLAITGEVTGKHLFGVPLMSFHGGLILFPVIYPVTVVCVLIYFRLNQPGNLQRSKGGSE